MQKIKWLVDHMALLVVGVAVLGAAAPWTLSWFAPYVAWGLGIVMFGMGMMLTTDDFRGILHRPLAVAIGVLAQFLIMPLLAALLVRLFGLAPELAIGVVLLGACPGGTASNVISYLAHGDVALSVSMTMCTTLLAPLVTPALTWLLAGAYIQVSFTAMMLSIAEMVLAPILLGLAVHHFAGSLAERVQPVMPLVSVLCIVLLVGCVVALSADRLFEVGALMAAVVVLHNGFGLLLGYLMARLCHMDSRQARTVSIEVGMQNSGLAASLAVIYFSPVAAIPGALFSVWHNISGSLVANYFVRRDERQAEPRVAEM